MIISRPSDIEKTSMKIIGEELSAKGIILPEENAPVIMRAIHTTADFDYAENLYFTPSAVKCGIRAFTEGKMLVTDTNMALSGVSKPALKKLGGDAVCFMADPGVAEEARARGTTRAAVSVDRAAARYPGCIFAFGNAPTALFETVKLMKEGFRPSLVIGVPVGFVNVVEAKEELLEYCLAEGIPAIVARGRKGGSNVAAAVCNALLYMAAEMLDPAKRG